MEEFVRDIVERRIPELRSQLEPLEAGRLRIQEMTPEGIARDITDAWIGKLKLWIAEFESIVSQIRAGSTI